MSQPKTPMRPEWVDRAARLILEEIDDMLSDAGQAAQIEQDLKAYEDTFVERVAFMIHGEYERHKWEQLAKAFRPSDSEIMFRERYEAQFKQERDGRWEI